MIIEKGLPINVDSEILSGTPVFDDGNFDCRRQYRRAKRSGRVI
jgi:hypothetical protein